MRSNSRWARAYAGAGWASRPTAFADGGCGKAWLAALWKTTRPLSSLVAGTLTASAGAGGAVLVVTGAMLVLYSPAAQRCALRKDACVAGLCCAPLYYGAATGLSIAAFVSLACVFVWPGLDRSRRIDLSRLPMLLGSLALAGGG